LEIFYHKAKHSAFRKSVFSHNKKVSEPRLFADLLHRFVRLFLCLFP
jgi:hypothetical protein